MAQIEFTEDELFCIESNFDHWATTTRTEFVDQIKALDKAVGQSEKGKEVVNKLLDEAIRAYDMCRMISAKCEAARNAKKKEPGMTVLFG